MEIKIGINNSNRELVIESTGGATEIETALREALATKDGVLVLDDDKGRRLLIPATQLSYLDLGQEQHRQVGFGSL